MLSLMRSSTVYLHLLLQLLHLLLLLNLHLLLLQLLLLHLLLHGGSHDHGAGLVGGHGRHGRLHHAGGPIAH